MDESKPLSNPTKKNKLKFLKKLINDNKVPWQRW
jgi:hypothetical protein